MEMDDNKVLSLINRLRQQGLKIPEFKKNGMDQSFFYVEYNNGFNLYFVLYSANAADSGYLFFLYKNFLSENKFNLNDIEHWGFDVDIALAQIHMQVVDIAEKINYPFSIVTVMDKDFVGLMAHVPKTN